MAVSSKPMDRRVVTIDSMDTGLAKMPVIVTGASKGIGCAIAVAYGREGARVCVTYQSDPRGAKVTASAVEAAGGEAMTVRFSLEEPTTATEVALAVRERFGGLAVRERFGGLAVLVNNAVAWPRAGGGGAGFRLIEETTVAEWAAPVQANTVGTFAMIHAALPLLRASPWARIVTISTGLVVDGFPGSSAYATGKAALHGLHRTLAKELGPAGILVNVLMSGAVDTRPRPAAFLEEMKRSAATGRLTEADDVARATVFLGSQANGHIHGEAVRCDGFYVSPIRRPTLTS